MNLADDGSNNYGNDVILGVEDQSGNEQDSTWPTTCGIGVQWGPDTINFSNCPPGSVVNVSTAEGLDSAIQTGSSSLQDPFTIFWAHYAGTSSDSSALSDVSNWQLMCQTFSPAGTGDSTTWQQSSIGCDAPIKSA
jgi:hypothetical protein